MTSSNTSEPKELGDCPHCKGPLALRPAFPYPVVTQALFGISFVAFLLLLSRIQAQRTLVWLWTAFQISLGIALVQRRLRAKKLIYRCIRCNQPLR